MSCIEMTMDGWLKIADDRGWPLGCKPHSDASGQGGLVLQAELQAARMISDIQGLHGIGEVLSPKRGEAGTVFVMSVLVLLSMVTGCQHVPLNPQTCSTCSNRDVYMRSQIL